jgi:hypothetical protein
MEKQRVLITVKTYPTLSRKYGETVCTAGVRPDGSWVRIYPVPFRRLEEAEQDHSGGQSLFGSHQDCLVFCRAWLPVWRAVTGLPSLV